METIKSLLNFDFYKNIIFEGMIENSYSKYIRNV